MLDKIRMILVRTSHPRNIGASARSLKTMGLSELYLVAPKLFPSEEATNLASHAGDVLETATVVPTLSEALRGCQLVFATSGRKRFIEWPSLNPREAAEKIKQLSTAHPAPKIAILFGNEKHGLSNEELETSHYQICIPTHTQYSSLNLAQSVQIIAYELFLAFQAESQREEQPTAVAPEAPAFLPQSFLNAREETKAMLSSGFKLGSSTEDPLASAEELACFYQALEKILLDIQFLKPERSLYLMPRLKRLFARATLSRSELNLLQGILTAIRKRV